MKIVTAAEMREIDRITTEKFGVLSLTLMENAGSAVAEFVLEEYPEAKRIGVLCGKGNNGGDGFVAARKLHEAGRQVDVLLLADPAELKGDAAEMFQKLPVKAVVARSAGELKSEAALRVFKADVLVDAIFGTAFKPPVSEFHKEAFQNISVHWERCVAVDIPSGVDCDTFSPATESKEAYLQSCRERVKAQHCVTFTAAKQRQVFDPAFVDGHIAVAHIGTPEEAIQSPLQLHVTTASDAMLGLSIRSPYAHKGVFGHVLVIGGSIGKTGAPAMAALAALRSGCGLATVATAASALPMVAAVAPEIMTEPLAETDAGTVSPKAFNYGRIEQLLAGKDVVALGPGLSRHPETAEFVRAFVSRCSIPIILDADGLNAFEGHASLLKKRTCALILTPHPGEMARLSGHPISKDPADRIRVVREISSQFGATVVLKGFRTLVGTQDGEVWVNPTGNPGMATGGTGDVLTGIIASLVAQGKDWASGRGPEPTSITSAVYLHGLAGDLAADEIGAEAMIATDLIQYLPAAFKELRGRADQDLQRIT
ncbi:MAG TPA: NAD(P)H-hydrate dehydratase [Terriglobales bacterium]|nr:NAD(P)H-hydrate dehydratase [Terriglobales bacterium]